ncbi:MAG: SpoIIIAH-like family protein [Clostridia bacterium]|nr:SpoIIIAH-like family protein [Clostridia bacterium]
MKNEKLKGFFSSRMAKGIIVASSALIIGLAVYLNYRWFYDPTGSLGFGDNNMDDTNQGAENVGGEVEDENSYFTSTALDRQEARDEAIDVLMLLADNEEASEEVRADAREQIAKIAADIQNEANIETLVKAKGFAECVTVISEGAVSVVVQKDELKAADTAQILTIVYETTGISPDKVSIINKG